MVVYNDRTCITQIIHEHDGDLTKDLPPAAKQVYRDDSAFMLTDILKGTMTSPTAQDADWSWITACPQRVRQEPPTAVRTPGSAATPATIPRLCGWDTISPEDARHIREHICRKNMENIMNQIHEGLEPWDWEQPESVELKADPRTGTQDYFQHHR